jgi:hypothetical protein
MYAILHACHKILTYNECAFSRKFWTHYICLNEVTLINKAIGVVVTKKTF